MTKDYSAAWCFLMTSMRMIELLSHLRGVGELKHKNRGLKKIYFNEKGANFPMIQEGEKSSM